MSRVDEKLTLASLTERLSACSIEDIYNWFGYDYSREILVDHQTAISDSDRARFITLFSWRSPPTTEILKRLFNQTSTFYAERFALDHSGIEPNTILTKSNQLCLFRHGKHTGLRSKHPYSWLYHSG